MNFVSVFDCLRNVAMKVPGCPTPVLQSAYVKAYRDWANQTRWIRMSVAGATVAGQALYDMGDDALLEIIAVYGVQGSQTSGGGPQYWKLGPSDSGSWDPNMPNNLPTRYAYLPEGQIAFNATPDKVYSMVMNVAVQPKDFTDQVPSSPLLKYSTEIEAGARAFLFSMKEMPWYDLQQARLDEATFQSGIANAKAEVARNYNTGSQRVTPRAFFR